MTTAQITKTQDIANRLVEACRKGEWEKPYATLFSPDFISIEAMSMSPEQPRETKGLEANLAKAAQWNANTEVHSFSVSDALVSDTEFAVVFTMDMTCKMTNQRMNMKELAVYKLRDGQIVSQEFIYDTSSC
jgi:ketosteroid isomerase-like protein